MNFQIVKIGAFQKFYNLNNYKNCETLSSFGIFLIFSNRLIMKIYLSIWLDNFQIGKIDGFLKLKMF